MTAGNALLIALIENHVAVRDHQVLRVVGGYLVGLQSESADARIDGAFANFHAGFFCTSDGLVRADYIQRIAGLYRRNLACRWTHRLILLQWINVRCVGDRIFDLAIDGIGLLSECERGKQENEDHASEECEQARHFRACVL